VSRVESDGASPTGPESKRSAFRKGCQPSSPNHPPFPSLPFRPLAPRSCRASPRRLPTRHGGSRPERSGRLAAQRVGLVAPTCPNLSILIPQPSTLNFPYRYSAWILKNWVSTGFNATGVEVGPTNRATCDQSLSEPDDSRRHAVVGAQSIARTHSLFSTR